MRPRPISLAALAAVATLAVASAQQPQGPPQPPSTQGLVKKGKAPVSNEVLKVTLPRPREATLASGLHLMVLEDHRLPRVTFQIIVPGAGGYFDPPSLVGLATYTAQMMREGTATRSSQQISQELETMAASVGASAGVSGPNASMFGTALTEHLPHVFAIAADILLNPAFPSDELERLKTRVGAELQQQRTQPMFLARERFNRVVYGDHPAARISATRASLDPMTREAMVELHRTRYIPDHAVIAFAGDITLADARRLVETALAGWTKRGTPKPTVTNPSAAAAPKVHLIARPASVQTTLIVGAQSLTRTDPDYEALTVANRVLGGAMGRLFRHLREEKGYTYGIGSGFSAQAHRGDWAASTSVRTEVTDAALGDLLAEIEAMREQPIPADELADSKRAIVASFALSLENPQSVLGYYIERWIHDLPADYWDTYPARISAVGEAEAQQAARKYWDARRLHVVAVGDTAQITDVLKKHGALDVFDADGNPVSSGKGH